MNEEDGSDILEDAPHVFDDDESEGDANAEGEERRGLPTSPDDGGDAIDLPEGDVIQAAPRDTPLDTAADDRHEQLAETELTPSAANSVTNPVASGTASKAGDREMAPSSAGPSHDPLLLMQQEQASSQGVPVAEASIAGRGGEGSKYVSYEVLSQAGPTGARALARDWLARVSIDGPGSVASALSLVIDSARPGSGQRQALVLSSAIIANEPAATVREACEEMVGDAPDRSHFFARRARSSYASFWRSLVEECDEAVLYDTDCFDTLLAWLESMSVAPSRPLRLSACVAAYAIVDGLITVGACLRESLGTAQRQLATEERRRGGRRSIPISSRGKDLKQKVDTLSANNVEVTELADKVFTSIFILKYRDVSPEVRVASVAALSDWTLRYPEHYLDDTHNKYIGWLLSDKAPSVRRAALEALISLFEQPKFAASLDMFLRRFVKRIVEMAVDKDIDVCVAAVRLCTLLVPLDVLAQDESMDVLCGLTTSEHAELRHAAGEFVAELVRLASAEENERDAENRSGLRTAVNSVSRRLGAKSSGDLSLSKDSLSLTTTKAKSLQAKKIRSMRAQETALAGSKIDVGKAKDDLREIIFTVLGDETGDASSTGLVLDAVWDHMPAVHCWKAYVQLLMDHANGPVNARGSKRSRSEGVSGEAEESDAENDQLGKDDMVSVASLLLSAARLVSSKPSFTQMNKSRRGKSAEIVDEQALFTNHIVSALPKLMTSFQTDERVLALLAELPRFINVDMMSSASSLAEGKRVIAKLVDVVSRSSSLDVVSSAAHTLKKLGGGDGSLASVALVALGKAASNSGRALRALVRAGLGKSKPDDLTGILIRAAVLSELVRLPDSVATDALALLDGLSNGIKALCGASSVGVYVCRLVAGVWMWSGSSILSKYVYSSTSGAVDEDEAEEAMRKFASRRDGFLPMLVCVMNGKGSRAPRPLSVRAAAFKSTCLVVALSAGLYNQISRDPAVERGKQKGNVEENSEPTSHPSARSKENPEPEAFKFTADIQSLMRLDVEDFDLNDSLRSCLLYIIANTETTPTATDSERLEMYRDARDALSSMGQIALLDAVPRDMLHLPLLGYVLRGPRSAVSANMVSAADLSKLYHARLRKTLAWSELLSVECALLLDAFILDEDMGCSSVGDGRDRLALRSVANVLIRCHSIESSEDDLGKLLSQMVRLYLIQGNHASDALADGEMMPKGRRSAVDRQRALVFYAGNLFMSRLSKTGASRILQEIDGCETIPVTDNTGEDVDASWHGLREFREGLEAVVSGSALPHGTAIVRRKKRTKEAGVSSSRDRGQRKRRRKNDGSFNDRRTDLNLANLRRSGRTQRRTYAEMESSESDDSEDDRDVEDSSDENDQTESARDLKPPVGKSRRRGRSMGGTQPENELNILKRPSHGTEKQASRNSSNPTNSISSDEDSGDSSGSEDDNIESPDAQHMIKRASASQGSSETDVPRTSRARKSPRHSVGHENVNLELSTPIAARGARGRSRRSTESIHNPSPKVRTVVHEVSLSSRSTSPRRSRSRAAASASPASSSSKFERPVEPKPAAGVGELRVTRSKRSRRW